MLLQKDFVHAEILGLALFLLLVLKYEAWDLYCNVLYMLILYMCTTYCTVHAEYYSTIPQMVELSSLQYAKYRDCREITLAFFGAKIIGKWRQCRAWVKCPMRMIKI